MLFTGKRMWLLSREKQLTFTFPKFDHKKQKLQMYRHYRVIQR